MHLCLPLKIALVLETVVDKIMHVDIAPWNAQEHKTGKGKQK